MDVPDTRCSEEDCERTLYAKGLCNLHYQRKRRGSGPPVSGLPFDVRFWRKVDKCGPLPELHPELGPCWLWIGTLWANGYGRSGPPDRSAHRVAYKLAHGSIAEGMQIDHKCHEAGSSCPGGHPCLHRRCVNPDHLEAVTQRENIRRGMGVAGVNARRTACINGHRFNEENTRIRPSGKRECRECARETKARAKAARRAGQSY